MKIFRLHLKGALIKLSSLLVISTFLLGCASFRSEIQGVYDAPYAKNIGSEKVSVVFILDYITQSIGFDAIPKRVRQYKLISDFDDIFSKALENITNIKQYSIVTRYAEDVNDPEKRAKIESLTSINDYTIGIRFLKKKSFGKHFLSKLLTTATLSIIPASYTWDYAIEVDICNREGVLLQSYNRTVKLKTWVQAFLLFMYPFHTEKMKNEEIFVEFLTDVFQQIESEKILKLQNNV